MREPIKRNPLGIRKLDVQEDRREFRRSAKAEAVRLISAHTLPFDSCLQRCIENALMSGYEEGVRVGAFRTRDRVAEALDNGTLVKP